MIKKLISALMIMFLFAGVFGVIATDVYSPSPDEIKNSLSIWDKLSLSFSKLSMFQATYIDAFGNTVSDYSQATYQCNDTKLVSGTTIFENNAIGNPFYFSLDTFNAGTVKFTCKGYPFCVLQLYQYVRSGDDAVQGSLQFNRVYKQDSNKPVDGSSQSFGKAIFVVYKCEAKPTESCTTWKGKVSGTREGTKADCGIVCDGNKIEAGQACFTETCSIKGTREIPESRAICRPTCATNNDCASDQFCWVSAGETKGCITIPCNLKTHKYENHDCVLKEQPPPLPSNGTIAGLVCCFSSEAETVVPTGSNEVLSKQDLEWCDLWSNNRCTQKKLSQSELYDWDFFFGHNKASNYQGAQQREFAVGNGYEVTPSCRVTSIERNMEECIAAGLNPKIINSQRKTGDSLANVSSSNNTILQKQLSLTQEQWNQATPKVILASACDTPQECSSPQENFSLECLYSAEIAAANNKAFAVDKTWACTAGTKDLLTVWGYVKGIAYFLAGPFWDESCKTEVAPQGTCRLTESFDNGNKLNFCQYTSFGFKFAPLDECQSGFVVIFLGILILLVLLKKGG